MLLREYNFGVECHHHIGENNSKSTKRCKGFGLKKKPIKKCKQYKSLR